MVVKRLQERVYDKDGGKCVLCGADVPLEEIHTMLNGNGKGRTFKNLSLICENCYASRKSQIKNHYREDCQGETPKKRKRPNIPEQLCWTCKKACSHDCSWAHKLKPVEGWNAVPTVRRDKGNDVIHSYHIYECPLYEKEEIRHNKIK